MDARKEGEILNDEDEVNGARKIRRKVISHLNIIFCGKAKCKSQIKIGINTQLTLKNIVFFNWILKINGKTLAKTIERIEGKKNELITKISESRGKTKTVEDYYRELLVRGLNSLKENEISPKLVEKRIKELYPDIKEEPKSEIEDSQKFEGWPIIWRLGDELFDMEMKYPHSEWVYQTIYQEISNRVVESVEELSENATRLLEFMNTRVMKDYDALEDTGSNYHEAADHVDERMNEFGQKIDELLSVLQNVNTANTQMEATVGDSTEKLSVVEKNNQGLQQEMKDISYAVEKLAASAGQLKESIRCFTVV